MHTADPSPGPGSDRPSADGDQPMDGDQPIDGDQPMVTGAMPAGPPVVGVDGCRGRWVVVTLTGRQLRAEMVDDLAGVIAAVRSGTLGAAAIDMPMGLLDDRPRNCDRQTRAVLGPRRASVFPAPVRPVLDATSYVEACALSRAASGRALSKQTWHLVPAIGHLDALVRPEDQNRVVEAHPECAFLRLAGLPLASKHDPEGRRQRHDLLVRHLGSSFESLARAGVAPPGDLADAAVLTVTARHLVAGTAVIVGDDIDRHGKRAQVVW